MIYCFKELRNLEQKGESMIVFQIFLRSLYFNLFIVSQRYDDIYIVDFVFSWEVVVGREWGCGVYSQAGLLFIGGYLFVGGLGDRRSYLLLL